jgi:hypothetical protein
MTDPEIFRLFEDADYDERSAYYRQRDAGYLPIALDRHGIDISEVHAVTSADGCHAICESGILEVGESGFFRKTMTTRLIPWADVGEVVRTEPTLKVYGIELRGRDRQRMKEFRWYGAASFADRDRIYERIVAVFNRAGPG